MIIEFQEFEELAIERIRKFYKIAQLSGFDVSVGFSGGKDSVVVYDLCKKSGIPFTAYFNHAFENSDTLTFIRTNYPNVIWRRFVPIGFIQNIYRNHSGLLPTVEIAYCCNDYKHNPKIIDKAVITGVRRQESIKRKKRTTLGVKNKTILKKNKSLLTEYFTENCIATGSPSELVLNPIIDWSDEEVWNYIVKHELPVNPNYAYSKRVGCMVCPKSDLNSNYLELIRHPKLIDAFIKAREKNPNCDWIITSDNQDYKDNKVYYICRWLNHSFMPFSKRQSLAYQKVLEAYNNMKSNSPKC